MASPTWAQCTGLPRQDFGIGEGIGSPWPESALVALPLPTLEGPIQYLRNELALARLSVPGS